MFRKSAILFAFLLILSRTAWSQEEERPVVIPPGDFSILLLEEAARYTNEYLAKNGVPTDNSTLFNAVRKQIIADHPGIDFNPQKPALTILDCENNTATKLREAAVKKYPDIPAAQLAKNAEDAYPLYKVGERVRVIYKSNPKYPETAEGVFGGVASGAVRVGSRRIRLRDMAEIENNNVEIQKFDKELNEKLRKEHIRKQEKDLVLLRRDFVEKNWNQFFEQEIKHCSIINEKSGYVFHNGYWQRFSTAIEEAILALKDDYLRNQQKQVRQQVLDKATSIANVPESLSLSNRLNLYPERPENRDRFRSTRDAMKNEAEVRAKVEQAKKEQDQKEQKAQASSETDAKGEGVKVEVTADTGNTAPLEAMEPPSLEVKRSPVRSIILILVVVIFLGGLGFVMMKVIMKVRQKHEDNRFNKFFEGKGKVQKDFWEMAAASPDTFKYVAYLFPSTDDANAALAHLSYITMTPNGDLKCSRDLYFGSYAHHGGAVAFVGGNNFNYAAWREASAILPELEGAKYFKVSTEPVVNFVPPDMDNDKFNITDMGIEELQAEDGSFYVCYNYSSDSKQNAMDFLNRFAVDEAGVMVRVTTPEGDVVKNENGISEI